MRSLLGAWPTTQSCALIGNQTGDTLICRPTLNALNHTSQGEKWNFKNVPYSGIKKMAHIKLRDIVTKYVWDLGLENYIKHYWEKLRTKINEKICQVHGLENTVVGFFFFNFLIIFREGKGGRKRERNINVWLPLELPPTGDLWLTSQACALTGNWTGNPLVHSLVLSPWSHTS